MPLGGGPRRPAGRRRILKRFLIGAAGLAVAATIAAWLARDLPRRRVEGVLAERIGAEVRLGSVSASGIHDFVLRDLSLRAMASQPMLETARVREMRVRGSLPGILAGRFEAIGIDGIEVRLASPPPGPPPPPAEQAPVLVGRLDVRDGRLVISGGGAETRMDLTASLTGVGADLAGEARVRAAEVALGPPLALLLGETEAPPIEGGSIEDLDASIRISDAGRTGALEARASRIVVRRGGIDIEIPSPSLAAEVRQEGPGAPLRIEARPTLPFVESLEAALILDPASGTVSRARVRATGIDVGAALRFAPASLEGWSLRGLADAEIASDGAGVFAYEVAARLDRAAFRTDGASVEAEGAEVRAAGSVRLADGGASGPLRVDLSLPRARARAGGVAVPLDLLPRAASLDAEIGAGPVPSVEGALEVATGGAGRIEASGLVRFPPSGPESEARFSWAGLDLERIVRLAREAGFAWPPGVAARGAVSVRGTLAGALAEPVVEGTADVAALAVEISGEAGATVASLADGRARARVSWRIPAGPVGLEDLSASGTVAVPPLSPIPISIDARGALDPAALGVRLDAAVLESPGLVRAALSGTARLEGEPHGAIRARVERMDLSAWRPFLRPLVGDPAPGYEVRGTLQADVEAERQPGGRIEGSGTVRVDGVGFASEDGARALEGLDTSWSLSIEGGAGGPAFALRAGSPVGGFQLLWGSFYLDGSSLVSSLDAEVLAAPAARGDRGIDWSGRLAWTLPEGPRVEASFELPRSGPAAGAVDLSVENLGTTVDRYLRAPLGDSVPIFRRIEAGGALEAHARATASTGAAELRGIVRARDVRVAGTGGNAEVEGLDLDLPFDLSWGPAGPDGVRPLGGRPAKGSVRFARAAAAGLEIPATETALAVAADSVSLEGSLAIPILGGAVGFEDLRLVDLLRPSRAVETGVVLSGIDLGEASRALGFLPLEGTLEGYLPSVRVSPSELSVTGGGQVSIFGGTVEIGDISGRDVLSRYPKLTFSASFWDIDLGRLTRRFDFGEMTGTIEGHVQDCSLFRGVPVRLEAEVRTVERKGVPRTINVKAINNIAILGTGGRVGVFDRGIHRFLDEYTYEALGIRMSLSNDVFLLRGLERRGGQELLLKGRLPFRIDVVNADPGKTVSFRTMLDRFRSLDFSAATTGP